MSKDRIDLTQFEGIREWKVIPYHHHKVIDWRIKTGRNMRSKEEAETIAKLPDLIAELKRCYRIIDILQDSEDFDTQVAFHEEGLCEYLKYPCGPCESSEEE